MAEAPGPEIRKNRAAWPTAGWTSARHANTKNSHWTMAFTAGSSLAFLTSARLSLQSALQLKPRNTPKTRKETAVARRAPNHLAQAARLRQLSASFLTPNLPYASVRGYGARRR